ncbi:MAG: hypothetical protein K1X28_02425 [Parachlamydiales bacterium]|nr:hypothetical protein [Parachlamydiales bacterium]
MAVNLPRYITPTVCANILSIKDKQFGITEENDFVVGRGKFVSLSIDSQTPLRFRDIIVLGHLKFEAENPEGPKAKIEHRNIIILGKNTGNHFDLRGENLYLGGIYSETMEAIQERFLEFLFYQRECRNQIGLCSILA